MKLPFRQGFVSYTRDGFGNPLYLQPSATNGFLNLNVSPTPVVVSVAHGASNYLLTFDQDVSNAWGPILPGVTSYLYWDVDLLTGAITTGITTREPIVSNIAPLAPADDQHWFDLSTCKMKVWKTTKWYDKIRAFAGKVPSGSIAGMTSADSEPLGLSWRNALPVSGQAGHIALDVFGAPLRMPSGEFVTSTSPVRFKTTSGTSGVLAVLPNAFVPVRATQNIPAMSLVYFAGENAVGLATGNPAVNPPRIPIGVVQDELSINEVGSVTQSGEITYDQWDWSAHIGKPLYCGDNGEIVTTRPNGLLAYRVGFVKSRDTILFQVDAETFPQVYQAGATTVIVNGVSPISTAFSVTPLGESIWSVSIQPASDTTSGYMTTGHVNTLIDLGTRLSLAETDIAAKAPIIHTHTIPDVAGLQLALDNKSDVGHNHDLVYAPIGHNHDLVYAPIIHTHTIPDVAGLQTALNSKAARAHLNSFDEVFDTVDRSTSIDAGVGNTVRQEFATKIDKVPGAVVGNFATFISGGNITDSGFDWTYFAASNHTHSISNITNLQTALDGKAPVGHTHAIAEVTNLQTALDGKAPTSHTHSLASLSDVSVAGVVDGQVLKWNAGLNKWVASADQVGSGGGGGSNLQPTTIITFGGGFGG